MHRRRNVAAVTSLTRILRSLLSPPKLLEVRSPHLGVVVSAAGGRPRAALRVKASGTGVLGRGLDKVAVDGAFDGVVFADVDIARSVCVLEYGGLVRRRRHTLPVTLVTLPPPPVAPTPLPTPTLALPVFAVSVEVP